MKRRRRVTRVRRGRRRVTRSGKGRSLPRSLNNRSAGRVGFRL